MQMNCVILVPGLGDRIFRHDILTKSWKKDGIEVIIHTAPWNKKDEPFAPKLQRLTQLIDKLHAKGYRVSLAGTSAGGSMVINAFSKRTKKIHRVINVCGRVREGTNVFPSLEIAARDFTAFIESVRECETNLKKLTSNDKAKIMTISPLLYDGLVPMSCIQIRGATNITVPVPTHMLGIGASLSIFKQPLEEFVKQF